MNQKEMIKKLEEIEKTVKALISQIKNQQKLSPLQQAVKDITTSSSTRDQVRNALDVLCQTPEPLSVKQTAFVLFFSLLNRGELGEDIDNWLNIQTGKHKYGERDIFLQQVWNIIQSNYNSKGDFKQRLKNYLNSKMMK